MPEHIDVFTDGSCHTQLLTGAWVALIDLPGGRKILQGIAYDTTHHRMELIAVIEALRHLQETGRGAAIRVITDSQYVAGLAARERRITANHFVTRAGKPVANADLLPGFYALLKMAPVFFVKIKAHQHNADVPPGNEEADRLSRSLVREAVKGFI